MGVATGLLSELIGGSLEYTRAAMPYIHCCGSVMSPGVGVDMGGCNIIMHNNIHALSTIRSSNLPECCHGCYGHL